MQSRFLGVGRISLGLNSTFQKSIASVPSVPPIKKDMSYHVLCVQSKKKIHHSTSYSTVNEADILVSFCLLFGSV